MNHDESDNERLADTFEQYRDDETTDHNPTAFGRTRTGKTERIVRHARHRADDADTVESTDLKGRGEENGG